MPVYHRSRCIPRGYPHHRQGRPHRPNVASLYGSLICSKTRDYVLCLSVRSFNLRGVVRHRLLNEFGCLKPSLSWLLPQDTEEIAQGSAEAFDLVVFLIHKFAECLVQGVNAQEDLLYFHCCFEATR
ncbi:hypothetical protein PF006_g26792 [Phytophthora fragariae]|uniref:Uncharacterized protein n=1 Tax=Phytophthora fragariae TaxID=53985 RepID=A0A6A3QTD8_9STRA|nr:hypothetical protein PF006_g26792 [Phytophthora fragariae]